MTHPGWEDWRIVAPTGEASASLAEKTARVKRRRRRRLRRRVLRAVRWSLLAVVIFVLVVCGWVALEARGLQADLEAAVEDMSGLQDDLLAGDADAVQAAVTSVQHHAGDAARTSERPHWAIAAALPWIGPNVGAVREMSDVIDDIAQGALPQVETTVAVLDPAVLAPRNGVIDVEPLMAAAPAVVDADAVMQDALGRLLDIDRDRLLPFVADAVDRATGELQSASAQTRTAARVVRLLPPMLGSDGPRDYLLLVQNNAEQRATGGIPGVVLQIHVEEGRLEIVDQQTAVSVGPFRDPVIDLAPVEVALFGTQLGRYLQGVTFTPHFPRTGELVTSIWRERFGVEVDGVLSVDPVALQAMLAATGPLTVDGVELTAEDTAATLLNGVYLDRPDPQAQDAFFAAAASQIFDTLTTGPGDVGAAIRVLAEQADDGRLLVWSAHPDEQAQLTGTQLAGELVGQVADRPVVGVFLNDGSAAKIGYYLDTAITVQSTECRPDGSQALTLRLTLTSDAPADAASSLPDYVTGANSGYVEPGEQRLNLLVYAPRDGAISEVMASDAQTGVLSQVHEGLPVVARTVTLQPGESLVLDVQVLTGPGSSGDPLLRSTPGPWPAEHVVSSTTCS